MPGVDLRHTAAIFFLKKHGFHKRGQRVNLTVELAPVTPDTPPLAEKGQYLYTRAGPADKDETVAFVKKTPRHRILAPGSRDVL